MLVVGDNGKLILVSPGTSQRWQKQKNPVSGGGAEVLFEDSSFGSYCLLETDNRARCGNGKNSIIAINIKIDRFVMGDLRGNVTLGWIDLEAQKLVRKVQVFTINLLLLY